MRYFIITIFLLISFIVNSQITKVHPVYYARSESVTESEATVPVTSGLILHLDASDVSSVTKDGSNRVSQWDDLSGNNNHATQSTGIYQPRHIMLNDVSKLNGHYVMYMDTGVVSSDGDQDYLDFPTLTTIRTLIIVNRWDGTYRNESPIMGATDSYHWHGGGDKKILASYASSNLRSGSSWKDGVSVSPTSITINEDSASVFSFVTIGDVTADQLAQDRDYYNRVWAGPICEVLIYNTALSDADRILVENYLTTKWLSGTAIDEAEPEVASMEVGNKTDSTIVFTLSDPSGIDQDSVPFLSAFNITEDGTVMGLNSISLSESIIDIVADSVYAPGTTILLDYDASISPTIQDTEGNTMSSFSDYSVTNNIVDPSEPTTSTSKPISIAETDLGGDSDDQATLTRYLAYSNEIDIQGIILSRSDAEFLNDPASSNPSGASTTLGMAQDYIEAYGAIRSNLIVHDTAYPTEQELLDVTVYGHGDGGNAGRDHIIQVFLDNPDDTIYISQWGSNDGSQSSIDKALDHVQAGNVAGLTYADMTSRLFYTGVYSQNHISDHRANIGLYYDTFFPDMDGGRWYHRWSPLTSIESWMDTNATSTLYGSYYTGAKESDTQSFMHLIQNGLNILNKTQWGGWVGRHSYQSDKDIWWNDQQDTYNGTTERDNTIVRWSPDGNATQAEEIQNDFKARILWAQTSTYSAANHHPKAIVNGHDNNTVLEITLEANSSVTLNASASTDPDSDNLSYKWDYYTEVSDYDNLTLSATTGGSINVTASSDFTDGRSAHIILHVYDDGTPSLTSYKRIILNGADEVVASNFEYGILEKDDEGIPVIPDGTYAFNDSSDYSTQVYIDPSAGTNGDGSYANPYNVWPGTLSSNTAYLQKKGTTSAEFSIVTSMSNSMIGAYGSGIRPVLTLTDFDLDGDTCLIRDLEINTKLEVGGWQDPVSGTIVYNCEFDLDSVGQGIVVWSPRTKIIGNHIHHVGTDGVFMQDHTHGGDDIEIAYNYMHHHNMKFLEDPTETGSPGDAIQFTTGNNIHIHHNIIDRQHTGNKFNIIVKDDLAYWGTTPMEILIENNILYLPADHDAGVGGIYLSDEQNTIVRHNVIHGYFEDDDSNGIIIRADNIDIYGNLFVNMTEDINTDRSGIDVNDNTFVDIDNTGVNGWTNVYNNILTGTVAGLDASNLFIDTETKASLFNDHANNDYSFKAGSPAVDAGTSTGYTEDITGVSVPQGSAIDVGAFELE